MRHSVVIVKSEKGCDSVGWFARVLLYYRWGVEEMIRIGRNAISEMVEDSCCLRARLCSYNVIDQSVSREMWEMVVLLIERLGSRDATILVMSVQLSRKVCLHIFQFGAVTFCSINYIWIFSKESLEADLILRVFHMASIFKIKKWNLYFLKNWKEDYVYHGYGAVVWVNSYTSSRSIPKIKLGANGGLDPEINGRSIECAVLTEM